MSLTTEMINEYVGKESEFMEGHDAVCQQMIRHWCEVMEDTNPLYSDEAYAASSKYGEIIAPPMQVQVFTMNPLWPERKRDPHSQELLLELMEQHGYTSIVATEQSQEYFSPMKIGDKIGFTVSVDKVSSEKQTSRGPGFFVTFLYTFVNQRKEVVCKQTFTILVYNAKTKEEVTA